MRHLILLPLAFLLLSLPSFAQVTWFSEVADSAYLYSTAWAPQHDKPLAVRLPDGNIGVVSNRDDVFLTLRTYSPTGELLSTHADPTPLPSGAFGFTILNTVEVSPDGSELVICGNSSCGPFECWIMFVATLDLATYKVKVAKYIPTSFFVGQGASASLENDGIYVVYGVDKYGAIAKYDYGLQFLWGKGYLRSGLDTLSSQHTSVSGVVVDSTWIVAGMDFFSPSIARFDASTGTPISYSLFPDLGVYFDLFTLTALSDGNLALSGSFGDPWIFKCTPDGDTALWSKLVQGHTDYQVMFHGVKELPDGRLFAMRSVDGVSNFKSACYFDGAGNLLSTKNMLPPGKRYNFGRPVVEADGLLAAGTATSDDIYFESVLQYTDHDLGQACQVRTDSLHTVDFPLGAPAMFGPAGLEVWDLSLPDGEGYLTLVPTTSPEPVVCTLVTSAVSPTATNGFTLFPNPAQGSLVNLSLPHNGPWQVSLLDATGRVLKAASFAGMQTGLSTDGLAAGVYLVRVSSSDGVNHTQRLMVR